MKRGFVRTVLLIIIALLFLSYFKIDLRNLDPRQLWDSDLNQGNINFIWEGVKNIWYNYIKAPIVFMLEILLGLIQ